MEPENRTGVWKSKWYKDVRSESKAESVATRARRNRTRKCTAVAPRWVGGGVASAGAAAGNDDESDSEQRG